MYLFHETGELYLYCFFFCPCSIILCYFRSRNCPEDTYVDTNDSSNKSRYLEVSFKMASENVDRNIKIVS